MAKLVSMKIDAKAREKMTEPASVAADRPLYPWGLSITLDNDALEKLGIDVSGLEVGGSKMLLANVEVTSLSSNESKDGGTNQSASLQITDCCLEELPKGKSATKALYGGDE